MLQALISFLKAVPALLELLKFIREAGAGTPEEKVAKIGVEFRNLSQAKTEKEYANVAKSLSNILRNP